MWGSPLVSWAPMLLLLLACAPQTAVDSAAPPRDTAPDTAAAPQDTAPPQEECDGIDNDGDGSIDEGFDDDGDGWTSCGGDCDDSDPFISPDAPDVCDGIDNDCSGAIDEDFDDDGDGDSECGTDCDDGDPYSSGHLPEICDGLDNNCDGDIDEGFDEDGDGWTTCRGDCDDTSAATWPGAEEICDGQVNDCGDDAVDETADADGDGLSLCDGDCDDTSADALPGGTEVCDGVDNDCSGLTDELPECYGCTSSSSYLYCTDALSQSDASAACSALSATLVSIGDAAENSTVSTLTGGATVWIGLTDRDVEGTWVWESGEAVSYTSWNSGEPNDSGGEDCVHTNYGGTGGWNDISCSSSYPFVCELL